MGRQILILVLGTGAKKLQGKSNTRGQQTVEDHTRQSTQRLRHFETVFIHFAVGVEIEPRNPL